MMMFLARRQSNTASPRCFSISSPSGYISTCNFLFHLWSPATSTPKHRDAVYDSQEARQGIVIRLTETTKKELLLVITENGFYIEFGAGTTCIKPLSPSHYFRIFFSSSHKHIFTLYSLSLITRNSKMFATSILASIATASMVFAPVAQASMEMQIIKYGTTDCSQPGGPIRDYHEGVCVALGDSDHAMKIKSYNADCKSKKKHLLLSSLLLTRGPVTTFDNGDCTGSVIATVGNIEQCTKILGSFSGRVDCSK